jgi:predicted nuclease of restriction endonuclease-like RecB superfamily
MLSGKMVRVRHARNRIVPIYIDPADPQWTAAAERLLDLYRSLQGCSRGELEEEIAEAIGDNPTQLVHQGLAKLLEDRCEFDVEASHPPDELREKVFEIAAAQRMAGVFDRASVLDEVGRELGVAPDQVDRGLFADLKLEQRLIRFDDCTVEQLLDRYNEALAQAVLMRSTGVTINIFGETPARFRRLFRAIKFHRLICDIRAAAKDSYTLTLDGPLSLFASTQKYGAQLAFFLPTLLQCKRFDLKAEVRWGPQRLAKEFVLDSKQQLRSHVPDYGNYVPKELAIFEEMFRKQIAAWEISPETAIVPVGTGFWTPDFVLTHTASGKRVYLEILGFWRKTDVDKHCQRLKSELKEPFVLAVAEQFNIDETLAESDNASIYQFKRVPLPEDIARLAGNAIGLK